MYTYDDREILITIAVQYTGLLFILRFRIEFTWNSIERTRLKLGYITDITVVNDLRSLSCKFNLK